MWSILERVKGYLGLMDEGETPEQAALRELVEETGYTGEPTGVSAILASDPGWVSGNTERWLEYLILVSL